MNEDDHHKEVYAHFGLAVYKAQVLEAGLVNALIFVEFIPSNAVHMTSRAAWAERYDAFEGKQFSKPMGVLIRALNQVMRIPDYLERQLSAALKRRNYVVHHYFREKVTHFLTAEGRDAMIQELESYGAEFSKADRMLEDLLEPLYEKYGFTPELQASMLEEIKREYLDRRRATPE